MHSLTWSVAIVTIGAVMFGVCYRLLDRIGAQPVRPIVGLTAAPIGSVWYLWFVTSNGDVYVRRISREGIDEPLRCLGGLWAHNSWDLSNF